MLLGDPKLNFSLRTLGVPDKSINILIHVTFLLIDNLGLENILLDSVPEFLFIDRKLHTEVILFLSKQNHEPGINEQFGCFGFKYLKANDYLSKQ